jgi:ABC transporter with metal-binding/Fe-S-binding domain ATP-binding protein
MKLGVLFSGGKDSTYAAYLAKKAGHELSCLITISSTNKESYMFHTPSIELTQIQAKAMEIALIKKETSGIKEEELKDLEKAIYRAKRDYQIQGVVTGAVESVYQATRIQTICNKLDLECFNPLWQKDQIDLLNELIKNKFEVILSGVFAYPFDQKWLGRKIDEKFIEKIKELKEKYKINPAGEGGEYESLVLNCPLFKKAIKIKEMNINGNKNSYSAEFQV